MSQVGLFGLSTPRQEGQRQGPPRHRDARRHQEGRRRPRDHRARGEPARLQFGDDDAFDFFNDEARELKVEVLGPLVAESGNVRGLSFLRDPPKGPRIGNESLSTTAPKGGSYSASHTINGHSIVLRIVYGGVSFLFTGDLNDEASRTLRSWVAGRPYPKSTGIAHSTPLIHLGRRQPPTLSFWNLIEAHVLRSLRTEHGVPMEALRKALNYAQRTLKIDRLLLSPELRTDAGRVLLERYGELLDLSASGQIAMRRMFNEHLARVDWDAWSFPVKLYPFTSSGLPATDRRIAIDPSVAFGRPIVAARGITTSAIAERIDAGETAADLAADYDLTESEIEEAVLFEYAA